MRALAFLVAALIVAPAQADAVYSGPAGYVRLSDVPCAHGQVLALVKEDYRPKFRHGWMAYRGRQLALCWILDGDSVFVVDQDGDSGRLPVAKFKRDDGV